MIIQSPSCFFSLLEAKKKRKEITLPCSRESSNHSLVLLYNNGYWKNGTCNTCMNVKWLKELMEGRRKQNHYYKL